jgi:hypothetical protein
MPSSRQAVISDHERCGLSIAEVLEGNCRDLAPSQQTARHDAAVSGNHLTLTVDQHRDVKSEGLDAARDLTDLLWTVCARISWIELQFGERPVNDRDPTLTRISGLFTMSFSPSFPHPPSPSQARLTAVVHLVCNHGWPWSTITMKTTKTDQASAGDFAERLRQLIQEFGSRNALAKLSGIPASSLQDYEGGAKPGMDALLTLARVGNVDLNWLLTGVGKIRPTGTVPGAVLAMTLMVDQYEPGTSLLIPSIVNQIPFNRHDLEIKLGLKEPTRDTLLMVEAGWNLYHVRRGDIVLVDRNQADLARDGIYLLDLPGLALRAISRGIGDKVYVTGPEHDPTRSSKRQRQKSLKNFSAPLEMSRSELLGGGRQAVSRVVGRAVWSGGAI